VEKVKHYLIVHGTKYQEASFKCNYTNCGLVFDSRKDCDAHKKAQGHIRKRRKWEELTEKEKALRQKRRVKVQEKNERNAKYLKSLQLEGSSSSSEGEEEDIESSTENDVYGLDERCESVESEKDLAGAKKRKEKQRAKLSTSKQLIPNGSVIEVWFDDRKRYFKGTVVDYDPIEGYQLQWGNRRLEYVGILLEKDMTRDIENKDRWNYF
jgi:hypothetical protein